MELNEQTYFSPEMSQKFLSVSQIKDFIGTPFMDGCEMRALATINGDYVKEKSESLLIGSYVDELLLGTEESLKQFIEHTPEMFYQNGSGKLLAKFQHALEMANVVKADKKMWATLQGEHQKILTGTLFGVPVKVKIDVLRDKSIIDLKTVEAITKGYYDSRQKRTLSFVSWHDYILQGSIYAKVAKDNFNKDYKFILACVSKEKVPDKALIEIDAETMNERLYGNPVIGQASLEETILHIDRLKRGLVNPTSCGCCEYCRKHKKVTKLINWQEIFGEVGE